MKKIIVKWVDCTGQKYSAYEREMRVMYSDHDRFVVDSRFDFGFLQIASTEGFVIEILPQ